MENWAVLITALSPLFLALINAKADKRGKDITQIKEIVMCNTNKLNSMEKRHLVKLRYTLYHDMREYKKMGKIDKKDFVELETIYNEYIDLGGNGIITSLFEEVKKLERTGEL